MKQINLLPKEEQRELRLTFFNDQLIRFWIWILVSMMLFVSITYIAKAYLSGQVAETEGQIALSEQILKSSDNELLKSQVEALNQEISALKSIQTQHRFWSVALEELPKILATDISLDTMVVDRATGRVDIAGVAGSRESVLKFWSDVHKSDYFTNINFPLSNLEKPVTDPFTFSFTIKEDKVKKP
jgi:Tfp pilus assembly protein PilN